MDDLLAPGDAAMEGGAATGGDAAPVGPTADGTAPGGDLFEPLLDEERPGDAVAPITPASDGEPLEPSQPESRRQRRMAALGRVLSRKPDADPAAPAVETAQQGPAVRMPWRKVSLALSIALAGLLTLTGFLAMGRVTGSGGSAVPSATAAATTGPGRTAVPAATAVVPSTTTAVATAAPSIPGPRPSATSPLAVVTFHDVVVDSPSDKALTTRTFTFSSDGPGPVSIDVVAAAPLDSTTLCYTMDDAAPVCTSGGTPGFDSLDATTAHSIWTVTLVAAGKTSPIVDLRFAWPTDNASITLTHGRLQGAPNPDSLRNLSVTFTTRAAGTMSLTASWPPASVTASLTLNDVGRRVTGLVDRATYLAKAWISPAYSHAVAARNSYQVVLANSGIDAGRPDLTATLTFP